jgi:hypothetical protein
MLAIYPFKLKKNINHKTKIRMPTIAKLQLLAIKYKISVCDAFDNKAAASTVLLVVKVIDCHW